MSFVGKDFLQRKAPKNYRAGVGRGAVGFSTTAERGGTQFPSKRAAKAEPTTDSARFEDAADAEADDVYAAIDRRKHRPRSAVPAPKPASNDNQEILSSVSIDEWAHIPEARDITHAHKRLRDEEQRLKRHYLLDSQRRSELFVDARRDLDLRKRDALQTMVRRQPFNAMGYIQLARLEEQESRTATARKIAARGCARVPNNEELWLLNIRLNSLETERTVGAQSRALAHEAVTHMPSSERLWLELVALQPTGALKLARAHEALTKVPKSEQLWLTAAELEPETDTKVEVLETALQFVATPALYLKLAEIAPSNPLAQAREKFPENEEIWLMSVKRDPRLAPDAVKALPREFWLANLERSDLGRAILPELKPTAGEFARLVSNKLNLPYMKTSEELCCTAVRSNRELLPEALRLYPHSEEIWSRALSDASSEEDLEKLLSIAAPPAKFASAFAARLEGRNQKRWISEHKDKDPHAWELARGDIDEGIARWPDYAPFYVLKSQTMPAHEAKTFLKQHADKGAAIWLALAQLETSAVRRRAVLTQGTASVPQSSELWIARLTLERDEQNPVQHLINEALANNPQDGKLWVENLKESRSKIKLLSEALKQSKMSSDVVEYGQNLFRSLGMPERADQLTNLAKTRAGGKSLEK